MTRPDIHTRSSSAAFTTLGHRADVFMHSSVERAGSSIHIGGKALNAGQRWPCMHSQLMKMDPRLHAPPRSAAAGFPVARMLPSMDPRLMSSSVSVPPYHPRLTRSPSFHTTKMPRLEAYQPIQLTRPESSIFGSPFHQQPRLPSIGDYYNPLLEARQKAQAGSA